MSDPPAPDLPLSVVRRLAARVAPEGSRFSPEAVTALALHAETVIGGKGAQALGVALAKGRRTVYAEDVTDVLALAQAARDLKAKRAPGSHAEQALARANQRLKKAGLAPELLGRS